jgi:hypothetical protein
MPASSNLSMQQTLHRHKAMHILTPRCHLLTNTITTTQKSLCYSLYRTATIPPVSSLLPGQARTLAKLTKHHHHHYHHNNSVKSPGYQPPPIQSQSQQTGTAVSANTGA